MPKLIGWALLLVLGVSAAGAAGYSTQDLQALQTPEERELREIRDKEIDQLKLTLRLRQPANRRADLYMRLAEAYFDAYRADFLLEGRLHDKRLAEGAREDRMDRTQSRRILAEGIHACSEVIRLGIRHERVDQVYFLMGFYEGERGHERESLRYYRDLVRKFPRSPFAGEAYRELADDAYVRRDYREALQYYERAAATAKGETLPRVLHRLAWTHYRLRRFDQAIAAMKDAVARTVVGNEKFLSIREEALRDMAIFMTERGKVDDALQYFSEVAGEKSYYPNLLEKLGRQYERNVESAKALQVYETLLKTKPESEPAFRVKAKLVELDLRRGAYDQASARLAKIELPSSSSEGETATVYKNLRASVRRTATAAHARHRKEPRKADLLVAERFYVAYLDRFLSVDDPKNETNEIQMYLAEVKRDLGKAGEASELYRKVLDSGDKRYAKEAGGLWTAALAETIKKMPKGQGAAAREEPTSVEMEFVQATDVMRESLGNTPETREAELRSAQVLAGYTGTVDEAQVRAQRLIDSAPKSKQALIAARLLVQIKADQIGKDLKTKGIAEGEAEDLRKTLALLKGNAELMTADRQDGGGKLAELISAQENRLRVGVISFKEKHQDFNAAAADYEAYARDAKDAVIAEKALAAGLQAYEKAENLDGARKIAKAWLARFPNSKVAVAALRSSATVAVVSGQYAYSIWLFETVSGASGEEAPLLTAIQIRDGTGDATGAAAMRDVFLKRFPKSASRWKIWVEQARAWDSDPKTEDQALGHYKICFASAGPELRAECGVRAAEILDRQKRAEDAKNTLRKVAALKGAAAASPYVGLARYRAAEQMDSEAKLPSLPSFGAAGDGATSSSNALDQAILKRIGFFEPLSRGYLAAVETGGPWGVAALERLAEWAERFADDIQERAPSAEAGAEARDRFRKKYQAVADQFRKRAENVRLQAFRKAVTGEVLSPSLPVVASRMAMASANPARDAYLWAQGSQGGFVFGGAPVAEGEGAGDADAADKLRDALLANLTSAAAWVDFGNLLWSQGKGGLARLAYDRALALEPRNAAALNNIAVIILGDGGADRWDSAARGMELLQLALKGAPDYAIALHNRARLLNYYRLFEKSKGDWDRLSTSKPARLSSVLIQEDLAIALHGTGQLPASAAAFGKSLETTPPRTPGFAHLYHEAARAWAGEPRNPETCLDKLEGLETGGEGGGSGVGTDHFENVAVGLLRKACEAAAQRMSQGSGK